jgi:hypothetical protein
MAFTQFTNLDFDQIKTSIKDYLRANSTFTDFDFEGSNLSILIDILAYNAYLVSYNTNMVANEAFLDGATLRENVVSLARNIGYVPLSRRAARASISFTLSGIPDTVQDAILKAGIVCTGNLNNTNYIFSVPEDITVGVVNGTATFSNIDVYEGTLLTKKFTINTSQPNQKYILPNPYIDTSTIRVKVKNTPADTTTEEYTLVDNIIDIDGESQIFLIQEIADEKYEIFFGDGIFGKKLENNNEITATYITTNGKEGNGASSFTFSGTILSSNDDNLSQYVSNVITEQAASNGDNIQSIESVRYYAPRLYASQYRAVTANDYEAILASIYPNIESVTAYGGEELSPPQYGKVFLAAKPKNAEFLSEYTKETLVESLKKYSVSGIQVEFVDVNVVYIELESSVYYNNNLINSPSDLRSLVLSSLDKFSTSTDLNKFGGRFKYSKCSSTIDNTSSAITSNITKVRIRRNVGVLLNEPTNYEVCFENAFNVVNKSHNIRSSGFTINNSNRTLYIGDTPNSDLKTGRLFLFRYRNNQIQIVSNNIGRIDYESGKINIDNINVSSTVVPNNIIQIDAIPSSNDVIAKKSVYLKLDVGSSNISMVKDLISSGENSSGSRFIVESSYFSDTKIRV